MLFSERSIWTMIHGIGLGGGLLLVFAAALYCLWSVGTTDGTDAAARRRCSHLGKLTVAIAVLAWAVVIVGTYINFPPYRATPPEGITDLSAYPRALLRASPDTAWLHNFSMEIKEHVPWMIAMLMTGVAFVITRYHARLLEMPGIRRTATLFILLSFALSGAVGLMGIFINKVAPLT